MIAVLSATTVTAGGAVYGLYYNTNDSAKTINPNTFMYQLTDAEMDKQVSAVLPATKYDENIETLSITFHTKELNSPSSFDSSDKRGYTVINEKTYNNLANVQHKEKLNVKDGYAVILDIGYNKRFSPMYTGKTITTGNGHPLTFQSFKTQTVLNAGTAGITVVVSDEQYKVLRNDGEVLRYRVLGVEDASVDLSAKIANQLPEEALFSSRPQDYQTSLESVGSLLL